MSSRSTSCVSNWDCERRTNPRPLSCEVTVLTAQSPIQRSPPTAFRISTVGLFERRGGCFLECGRVLFLSEVKRTEWDERPVGAWRSPMKKANRSENRPLKVEVVKPGSDRIYPVITGYRNRNRNSRYRPVKQHPTHGGIEPRPSRTNQKVLKVTTYKLKASS